MVDVRGSLRTSHTALARSQDGHPDRALIEACAADDRRAQRELMRRLMPVLEAQVASVARRAPSRVGRDSRREVCDLLQDVLVELFRNQAQELRRWDPERGLSLEGFVRLVARRHALRKLLRGKPERLESTEPEVLESHHAAQRHDAIEERDLLDAVLRQLHKDMSPRDVELFQRLFLEEQSSATVAEQMNMTPVALKKWRSRMYQRTRAIADKLHEGPSLRAELARKNRMSLSAESGPTNPRGRAREDGQ